MDTPDKLEEYLVVDAGPFIKGHGLKFHLMAKRVVTTEDVIRELRDSKTREILDILPYELEIMTPSREAMREVADFARKTGDFASLSATDLRLIALSLMIEKELNGESFIKKEPNSYLRRLKNVDSTKNQNSTSSSSPSSIYNRTNKYVKPAPSPAVVINSDEFLSDVEKGATFCAPVSDLPMSFADRLKNRGSSSSQEISHPPIAPSRPVYKKPSEFPTLSAAISSGFREELHDDNGLEDNMDAEDNEDIVEDMNDDINEEDLHDFDEDDEEDVAYEYVEVYDEEDDNFDENGNEQNIDVKEECQDAEVKEEKDCEVAQTPEQIIVSSDLSSASETISENQDSFCEVVHAENVELNQLEDDSGLSKVKSSKKANKKVKKDDGFQVVSYKKNKNNKNNKFKSRSNKSSSFPDSMTTFQDKKSSNATAVEDDGLGWISNSNLNTVKVSLTRDAGVTALWKAPEDVKLPENSSENDDEMSMLPTRGLVATLTNDFALQNVLLQMGMRLRSVDGQQITCVKQFLLRCVACFHLHYDTQRLFCSQCGIPHLTKVAASVNAETGELRVHLKKNYQVSTKGLVYPLPAPGTRGRYEGDYLLREDQLESGVWRQRLRKVRKDVSSAFGESITQDVGLQVNKSSSVFVGVAKRNPNQLKGRERRGKKK